MGLPAWSWIDRMTATTEHSACRPGRRGRTAAADACRRSRRGSGLHGARGRRCGRGRRPAGIPRGHRPAFHGHQHARQHGRAELAHAVRNRWPPIKILVVSGQQRLQTSDLPPNSCFLGKPYQAASIGRGTSIAASASRYRASATRRQPDEPFCSDSLQKSAKMTIPIPRAPIDMPACPDCAGRGTGTT